VKLYHATGHPVRVDSAGKSGLASPEEFAMTPKKEDLRRFVEERCLIHRPEGIRLASGKISRYYLDCRVALLDPRGLPLVAEMVLERVAALPVRPVAIGGAIVGAVPITAAVVLLSASRGTPLAGFMVRREVKTHGTQKRIENPPPPGSKVVIVEDVVTTGGSTLDAIAAAEEAGLSIAAVIPLVDREEGGGDAIRARVPDASYQPLLLRSDFPALRDA
jgi:orotate phosphoribosyltransferase